MIYDYVRVINFILISWTIQAWLATVTDRRTDDIHSLTKCPALNYVARPESTAAS